MTFSSHWLKQPLRDHLNHVSLKKLVEDAPLLSSKVLIRTEFLSNLSIIEFETETPTKQFNGLKDMLTLTPETDDEQAKQNKDTKKEMSYSRPTDQVKREKGN